MVDLPLTRASDTASALGLQTEPTTPGGIPPPGSLVFLRFQECDFPCEQVASWEDYRLMRATG